jgi:uracil-DNA glycosylase
VIELATAAPKRLRHTGDWPTPTPRRAPAGTELRALQEAMPHCEADVPPVLSGDGSERAMLIGQAPGWREIETGLPFAWDAGKRLCGWFAAAGIGVDDFRERWYVTSVGKCYPGRAPGSSVDRPPSRTEIERWSPELRLVQPALLVLVGSLAHRIAFGASVRLDELVGRELSWDAARGASVLCLPHPSGASTWLNDPRRVELWREAIRLLRDRWAEVTA